MSRRAIEHNGIPALVMIKHHILHSCLTTTMEIAFFVGEIGSILLRLPPAVDILWTIYVLIPSANDNAKGWL